MQNSYQNRIIYKFLSVKNNHNSVVESGISRVSKSDLRCPEANRIGWVLTLEAMLFRNVADEGIETEVSNSQPADE